MYRRTTRIKFDVIKSRIKVKVRCRSCNKLLNRVLSEYQTINPFNKREDGGVKTQFDIDNENMAKLEAKKKKLLSEGIVCSKCDKDE